MEYYFLERRAFLNSILIITNKNKVVFDLKKILINDYIIYNAKNAEDALNILKKHVEIELVLLESNIVEKDNFEILKKIKEKLKRKLLIVGIYSEEDDEIVLNIMLHNGVDHFIYYPFKPKFLLNRLQKILISEDYKRYKHLEGAQENSLLLLNRLERERIQHLKEVEEIQKQMATILEQSKRESLTNLYNRRSFEEKVAALIQTGKKGCIMMLDIDDFKLINDTRGHVIGDKILLELANCFKNFIKDKGFVGRLGGDEFAFFIENIEANEKQKALQAKLSERVLEIGKRFNLDFPLTVSIGVTCLTKDVKSFTDIYEIVDKMMYNNKLTRKKARIVKE